jgi:hypothetical protein
MNEATIAAAPGRLDLLRLASIFVGLRLRTMRNAFRVRQRGRSALLVAIIGLVVGFAYVTLFAQAFSIIAHTVGFDGQLAALAVVTGTIAFGSLAARAASSEAVRAGSPENEFLLARPVSLATMVAARGLADAVTDPVGALFMLPVLIAATYVWHLGPAAWLMAAAIAFLMQVGISMLAYATQLAIVRWIPGRRRRGVWTALRLIAALSLAMLWLLSTSVMRAPAALAAAVGALAPKLAFLPSMLVGAPLGALARGAPGQAALALLGLTVAVGATVLLVMVVAGRAGMAGWEEAGAVWAEATSVPRPTARLVTAATKDLRLIIRERSQLLALIAMPVIFVGVQVFGAAGWDWMTAGVDRISWLSYSLALYMCTIGPLTHMQAERRAFWILRTVPVPLSHLLAGKARAWSVIVGGIAALAFAVLCLSVPHASLAESLAAGLLVTAGAAGMSFVAVAMAAGGADLSDDTATAVGPTTIYAFMFVGGLFNVVLTENAPMRIAGLALYGFAAWTYWQAGIEQATFCLDAEAVRTRRVRAADGATMLIIYALGGRAIGKVGSLGGSGLTENGLAIAQGVLVAAIGIAVAVYLARRPAAAGRRGLLASLAIAVGIGACGVAAALSTHGSGDRVLGAERGLAVMVALFTLPEEAILRGVVQRALPVRRVLSGPISAVIGVVSAWLAGVAFSTSPVVFAALIISHVCGALVYALTGRVAAAWVSRVVTVGVAAFV